MTNTSATGGALVPSQTAGLHGVPFEDFLQQIIVGVSGLAPSMVRPRWQPKPPPAPPAEQSWAAIGITGSQADTNAYQAHISSGDGSQDMQRHEDVDILVSCYGPAAHSTAGQIQDGLYIRQNREALFLAGAGLVEANRIVVTADLINQEWRPRTDLFVRIRRVVKRTYPILNLLAAHGAFVFDEGTPPAPFIVEQP